MTISKSTKGVYPVYIRCIPAYIPQYTPGYRTVKNCIVLTSNVFDWSTHVTDRWTEERDGRATAYYAR